MITIAREGKGYQLSCELLIPRTRDAVFEFFSDAFNLEKLTPPFLRFTVLTPPPIEMRVGTLIDYRLKIHGVPIRWQSEITAWNPPEFFVDEQRRGPYRWWNHRHEFIEHPEGTMARDAVSYAVPGGALIHRLFIERDNRRIFTFRAEKLAEIFGSNMPQK